MYWLFKSQSILNTDISFLHNTKDISCSFWINWTSINDGDKAKLPLTLYPSCKLVNDRASGKPTFTSLMIRCVIMNKDKDFTSTCHEEKFPAISR